jgi:phage terminase large subunit-like protein
MAKDNYIYAYYQGIKDGTITVGEWIQRVYDYIIKGLQEKAFYFDQKKANDVIDWLEAHAFHTEGELAPGLLKLELWQKAFLSCVYGIVDENGRRQFREILLIVGRKNGKTKLMSALGDYEFRQGGYGSRDMGALMAMLVLAIIPIVAFYALLQKHIIRGVIAGAIKE